MSTKPATQLFLDSWSKADQYPLSLIKLGANIGSLRAHEKLLKANAPNLFYRESRVKVIEFFKDDQSPANSRTITNNQDLLDWLVVPSGDASAPISVSSVRSRFIFFQAPSSEAHLDVTSNMACLILTYFQVMPSYIDFLSVFTVNFGEQVEAVELRFSGFRERVLLSSGPARGLQLPDVALSGQNYQLCYNLKCVALKYQHGDREDWLWSARQGSFHHQFDVKEGTTLWIITSARDELRSRVNQLTGEDGRAEDRSYRSSAESFISSFAVHLLLVQWATEDWRGYIRWLEQVLEEKTIYALRDSDFEPSAKDISFVQKKQDETNKAIMMLEANANILLSLEKFYRSLMQNANFELKDDEKCNVALADFLLQLQDFGDEFQMHAARARTLGKITADRKNLVQQHLQAHSTEQMKFLTKQAQREAVNMRVIAIMTFLLLPATFVSTFFSTDVVKYQSGNNYAGSSGESYSALAMQRWFEVAVPLTMVTFALAGCLLYWETVKTWPKRLLRRIRRRKPVLGDEEKEET